MKKSVVLMLAVFMLFVMFFSIGCSSKEPVAITEEGNNQSSTEPITLVMNHSSSSNNPLYTVYEEFARLVKEKSDGQLIIEVHSNNELGTAEDSVQLIKMGAFDISSINSNAMISYCDAYEFVDLPYIFKDYNGVRKVFEGEIGNRLKKQVEDEIGIKVLMYNATGGGFRVVANNQREVRVPEDMAGLKIRATNSEVEVALLKEWGSYPTPISFSETYTALQQGVVQGEHIQIGWITQGKHEEIIKHVTKVNTMTALHIAIMDAKIFNSLPEKLQNVILEASAEAQALATELDQEYAVGIEDTLKEAGVQIYEPTEQEMQLWRDTGKPIWKLYSEKISDEFIAEVLAVQE